MERLQPLEKLDKDYYLGEQAGWYSDGENHDSESSNDELQEQISKLAGVRRCKHKSGQGSGRERRTKDEFESDMDDELDERLVAHASQFMQAQNNALGSSRSEGNSVSAEISRPPKKSVSFKDEPKTCEMDETSGEEISKRKRTSKSAFDDTNNLLRRAVDRAREEAEQEVEFYDANEDDDNEQWVKEHRRRLGLFSDEPKGLRANGSTQKERDDDTDAVLSCPSCMTLLSRQCQRHEIYRDQYRAMFVENCKVMTEETIFMPETGRKRRRAARKCATAPKPNTVVGASEATTLRREDLFHPVQCAICATAVGVYDVDEVYHFFNVLTGYA
ncbi:unnamed protein product [Toxocara canis]|uniref:E2F-associated phosphoprotein n=1 Tax=Toxocara canis TaxID=6265 RepID=A0A183UIU8_TOXCA|nr:unnamed protein product [Toxocara canis]